jgi:amino acid adenylation domain-containing protein
MNSSWVSLAAEVLQLQAADIQHGARDHSFVRLGGSSLRAAEFVAKAGERFGFRLDIGSLLGTATLAEVTAAAQPADPVMRPIPAAQLASSGTSSIQAAILLSEELGYETAHHLLFSADICGRVDSRRLRAALECLTRRHEALRTVFVRGVEGSLRRRVLSSAAPQLIEQALPPTPAADPVSTVHALLEPASSRLLHPFARPPVIFVHTKVGSDRSVLSLLIHHAIVDGWAVGLLWREFSEAYEAGDLGSLVTSLEPLIAQENAEPVRHALVERLEALADAPGVIELPSDLTRPPIAPGRSTRLIFGLSGEAVQGCDRLRAATGLTRNTVLLAAWALTVARRSAASEVVIGVASMNRPDAAAMRVVGPYVAVLPVRCQVAAARTVRDYVAAIGEAARSALVASAVPLERLAAGLSAGGDRSRNSLIQVAFAAHDELIPAQLQTADLTLTLHEGHCRGSVFDAVLFVQEWGESPRLALEYATSVMLPGEASALARAFDSTLAELGSDPGGPLADVRSLGKGDRQRLIELGTGLPTDSATGIWQLFEDRARQVPDQPAIRDGQAGLALTYGELLRAVEVQSAQFAVAGITEGDCVGVAIRRSAREIVALLAIMRLGAAYLGIEADLPEAVATQLLDGASSRFTVGEDERLRRLGNALRGRTALTVRDPLPAPDQETPLAAGPDPSRVAYVAFTSGSTGAPKGAQIPHRAIVRLVREPDYLLPRAADRFLRLAPLGFDASTLEIFTPLAAGGCIEVYPDPYVVPDDFAEFIMAREVTGMWLTAGLFRLIANYRPDAFRKAAQVLTGGDIVPPEQARLVLQACPGLRITNGYGPTENTTFTACHHLDDPAEVDGPLPIGRPIRGTSLAVLDSSARLVPPGGIGELYAYGDGLAHGYIGRPAETQAAFGRFSPDIDARLYRTGDMVRWDTKGRLCFIGRHDQQVKVRGFRIELDGVARILREHPDVRDAVVVATGLRYGDQRLLAGLVAEEGKSPHLDELRTFAAGRLPGHAVPALWVLVTDFPVTANGKLDVRRLEELAQDTPEARTATTSPAQDGATTTQPPGPIEQVIASAWREILGTGGFGLRDSFFDVGGDSLQMLRLAARLNRSLPDYPVTVQALFAHPTISALAAHLQGRSGPGTDST